MPEPTLFLVAYEDSYLSEIRVAFTDEALALQHAEDTGGVVLPIRVFDKAPDRTIRYTYTTAIRSNGIIERRDFFETPEWEYDSPVAIATGERTRTSVVISNIKGGGHMRQVITYGYDQSRTAADHEQTIKDNKGIDL